MSDTKPSTSEPREIDSLRQLLRSLGYLDAGVDRFVLAPASGRRGTAAVALRSSLRVGLLGGALLGPAAAVGLGARVPGLVSGVRDAVVLAVYLAIVFFVCLTVASAVVSLAAGLLARGGERFARRASVLSSAAGWILAIGCLAYLTFWWRNASAGFGWNAPVLTASVLALAVSISLLLGHAVRIATLGSMLAGADPQASMPRAHRASWRVAALGGVLAFAGAAALLVVTASAAVPAPTEPLTVVSTGHRVHVVAIDGVDPTLLDERQWLDTADVQGARYTLQPQDTSDPARAWTTIATGEPPAVHGIHAIEARRVAGLRGIFSPERSAAARAVQSATDLIRLTTPSLASRDQRRAMTFWEVAEAAGLRTAVVNWWATWPALSQTGVVVSDRAVLRLEHGGALDAEIAPASAYQRLQGQWPAIAARAKQVADASFTSAADSDVAAVLKRSAALDATMVELQDALGGPERDLDVLYLPGLDIAQHTLLAGSGSAAPAPSALATRVAGIRAYYAFLGSLLRPRLADPTGGDVIALVAQPGRVGGSAAGHLTIYQGDTGGRAGIADAGSASVLDIAPTVLAILGVPLSRELPGHPLAPIGAQSARFVGSYGAPFAPAPVKTGHPLDREMIERLKSLGYVK